MNNSLPSHEHDSTFKLLFEDPKEIIFLVKNIIGYSWAKEIDEGSVELADKEFVDDELRQNRADIIAKAKLKDREVYFYILIENQSTVDRTIPERLLKYMILLWARKIKEGAKKLPAIIPIVTYNGLEKAWDVPQEIISEFDMFKDDILRYRLVDITNLKKEELFCESEDVLTPVVFYLEQVRYDPEELSRRLREVEPVLMSLTYANLERFLIWSSKVIRPKLTEEGKGEFDRIKSELLQGGGVKKMGDFVSNVSRLLDEVQMRKFNEGRIEGRIEVAKKLIRKGFSDEEIAELTELEIEKIRELRKEMQN